MSRVDGAINVNVSFQIGYNMSPLGLTLENGLTYPPDVFKGILPQNS